MAKEYRKRKVTHGGNGLKQLSALLMSFLFGYLTATVFDLTSLTNWLNKQLVAKGITEPTKATEAQLAALPKPKFEFYTVLTADRAAPPVSNAIPTNTAQKTSAPQAEPVLTMEKPSPELTTATSNTPTAKPITSPLAEIPATATHTVAVAEKKTVETSAPTPVIKSETYLLQVASFRSRHEAENMKAALVLKGFSVAINIANQQNVNWYRVNLGPFTSYTEADKAKRAIAQSQHIMGMIRKISV